MIVTSRSLAGAQRAVEQLREEVGLGIDITGGWACTRRATVTGNAVAATVCPAHAAPPPTNFFSACPCCLLPPARCLVQAWTVM